jgi:hypothetical protein
LAGASNGIEELIHRDAIRAQLIWMGNDLVLALGAADGRHLRDPRNAKESAPHRGISGGPQRQLIVCLR